MLHKLHSKIYLLHTLKILKGLRRESIRQMGSHQHHSKKKKSKHNYRNSMAPLNKDVCGISLGMRMLYRYGYNFTKPGKIIVVVCEY